MGRTAILGLLAVLALTGPARADERLPAGAWRIVSIAGAQGLDPARATADIADDGTLALTIGCNRIRAKPEVTGTTVDIGRLVSTRMACPPPLDAIEAALVAALAATRSRDAGAPAGQLVLADATGTPTLTLSRRD
jgi:heat shock protein HslJ